MNYISQLNAFWERQSTEGDLSPTAISIYLALLNLNNRCGWKIEFLATYGEVLNLTGIGNNKTYYAAIDKLVEVNLISYRKGKNQFQAASFTIKVLYQKTEEQPLSIAQAGVKHTEEQSLSSVHILKQVNNKNIKTNTTKEGSAFAPPSVEEVICFFCYDEQSDEMQAEMFFNHYNSNGWLVGGRAKMKDWKSAAKKWILRSAEFSRSSNNQQRGDKAAINAFTKILKPVPNWHNGTPEGNYTVGN